jgi:hypothetical protein
MLDPKLCDPPKFRQLFNSRKGGHNIPESNLEPSAPWKYNYSSVGPDTPCLVLNPQIPYCSNNSPFKYFFAYLIINSFRKCYFYSSFENVFVFLLLNVTLFKCHFWMIRFKECSGTAFPCFFCYFSLSRLFPSTASSVELYNREAVHILWFLKETLNVTIINFVAWSLNLRIYLQYITFDTEGHKAHNMTDTWV